MTTCTSKKHRLILTRESNPRLPRHIKLRFDAERARWVLLAPERVFNPDRTAVAVLTLCDGSRTIDSIAHELAAEYAARQQDIEFDMLTMLQDLADKGVVVC